MEEYLSFQKLKKKCRQEMFQKNSSAVFSVCTVPEMDANNRADLNFEVEISYISKQENLVRNNR